MIYTTTERQRGLLNILIKINRSKKLRGQLTRRDVLQGITVSNFLFFGFGSTEKWARAGLLPTLRQAEGPFYPIKKPIDQDADLTFVSTRKKRAQGEICIIRGRVFDVNGKPLSGVLLEIWQANKWGRYRDRRDSIDLPWDHNFQGYGKTRTDHAGYYTFKTIRPAGYGQGRFRRTPHIHFKVNKRGFNELITQMYFAGEPENKSDIFFRTAERSESILVEFKTIEGGSKLGTFNLILG